MNDSVTIQFEEAMLANSLTSEREIKKHSDEYDFLSDEKPGYLKNVLMLPIKRSRRFSLLLGFWEGPSPTDPPVPVPVTVDDKLPLQAKQTNGKRMINPLFVFTARLILSELEALVL